MNFDEMKKIKDDAEQADKNVAEFRKKISGNIDIDLGQGNMYQTKKKSYGIIAIIYYCIFSLGLFLAGILYQKGFTFGMNIIYCSLFAVGVLIALIKDRNIYNLGFGKEKLRINLIISLVIVVTTFIVIWVFSDFTFHKLLKQMLYYLFYIAAIEEILFRGLIQNYLFGLKLNKYVIFIIGALLRINVRILQYQLHYTMPIIFWE